MSPALRRAAILSAGLHVIILAALLIGIPFTRPPEPPQDETVAMVFMGVAQSSMKAPTPAPTPAPSTAPPAPPAPQVTEPPKPQPVEVPPPPPPPPPAPPPPPQAAPAPPTPTPPTPPPPPTPALAPPTPPPPPAPPSPPQQQTPPQPAKPLPLPPPPAPVPPAPESATSQPNPTKNPAPNSQALDNTLEKLRQLAQQTQPPKARSNPQAGGAPNSGGNPLSNDTSALSAAQRGAIGDHVRACWSTDPGMLDLDKMQVLLTVTTDGTGVARQAVVASEDQGRVAGDMRLRVFAERAVRAVLDPHCANLPLPQAMLGKTNVLTFRFSP
jgi:neural Wiskott-Aldrich syndrome protein